MKKRLPKLLIICLLSAALLSALALTSFADGVNDTLSTQATYYGLMRIRDIHIYRDLNFEHWHYDFPNTISNPNQDVGIEWGTSNMDGSGGAPSRSFYTEILVDDASDMLYDFRLLLPSNTNKLSLVANDFVISQDEDTCFLSRVGQASLNFPFKYTIEYDVVYKVAEPSLTSFEVKHYQATYHADANAPGIHVLELGVALTGLDINADDLVLVKNYVFTLERQDGGLLPNAWLSLIQPLAESNLNGTFSVVDTYFNLDKLIYDDREFRFASALLEDIDRMLDVKLFGEFSIGQILGLCVVVPLFIFILKRFAGG